MMARTRFLFEEKLEEQKAKKNSFNPKKCPECKSEDIAHEGGEFYCKKCGYVLENI